MVDPISNTTNPSETGQTQSRPQASPQIPGTPDPATNLAPDQRIQVLQSAVQKLIQQNMPSDSRLQITRDKTTGTYIYQFVDPTTGKVLSQYPPEQLVQLHNYLDTMQGMLVDTTA